MLNVLSLALDSESVTGTIGVNIYLAWLSGPNTWLARLEAYLASSEA